MKSKNKMFIAVFLCSLPAITAACVPVYPDGRPVRPVVVAPYPWIPAHGRPARYHYRYFPSHEVYFDPLRSVYFYADAGGWRMSASLPAFISLDLQSYVVLDMDVVRPYVYHKHARKTYPRDYWKRHKPKKKIKVIKKKNRQRDRDREEYKERRQYDNDRRGRGRETHSDRRIIEKKVIVKDDGGGRTNGRERMGFGPSPAPETKHRSEPKVITKKVVVKRQKPGRNGKEKKVVYKEERRKGAKDAKHRDEEDDRGKWSGREEDDRDDKKQDKRKGRVKRGFGN